MTKSKAEILIVEDEVIVAMELEARLRSAGYAVAGTTITGEDAIEMSLSLRPDLVLMDVTLGGDMNGLEAAEAIRTHLDIPIIYVTAHGDLAPRGISCATDSCDCVVKPFRADHLLNTIASALEGRNNRMYGKACGPQVA